MSATTPRAQPVRTASYGAAGASNRRSGAALLVVGAILVLARVLLHVIPAQLALDVQQQYTSWFMLPVVVLLGFVGWWVSPRIGIPPVWDDVDGARARLIYPALLGLAIGAFWVLVDALKPVSYVTHATFPGVIFFYTYSAIFVEVLNRLFFATIVTWLVAIVILRGRGLILTYWIVAGVVTLTTALGQAYGTYQASGGRPDVLDLILSFGLAAIFEPVAFYLYRKAGFLAPLIMKFVFYVIWHMVWGGLIQQVLLR